MLTKTNQLTPAGQPSGLSVIAWFGRLRVRLQNLRCWKTQMAYRTLTKAMKRDPDFAHTWQCNIACPLMDAGMNHRDANAAADRLMRHLFGVVNYTEPNMEVTHTAPGSHPLDASQPVGTHRPCCVERPVRKARP